MIQRKKLLAIALTAMLSLTAGMSFANLSDDVIEVKSKQDPSITFTYNKERYLSLSSEKRGEETPLYYTKGGKRYYPHKYAETRTEGLLVWLPKSPTDTSDLRDYNFKVGVTENESFVPGYGGHSANVYIDKPGLKYRAKWTGNLSNSQTPTIYENAGFSRLIKDGKKITGDYRYIGYTLNHSVVDNPSFYPDWPMYRDNPWDWNILPFWWNDSGTKEDSPYFINKNTKLNDPVYVNNIDWFEEHFFDKKMMNYTKSHAQHIELCMT